MQEFDIKMYNKSRKENVVADHLSRIVADGDDYSIPIDNIFPDENLFFIATRELPYFIHIVNYLASGKIYILEEWDFYTKKRFRATPANMSSPRGEIKWQQKTDDILSNP